MRSFRLSAAAENDIEAILAWTHSQFGEQLRLRYEALLVQAILDLADDPERPGSTERPELSRNVHTYHLRHSRDRVSPPADRIRKPRHFLLYRIDAKGSLEIGRVLHDSMDLARHLPMDYRASDANSE